jgi:hypothetical protein
LAVLVWGFPDHIIQAARNSVMSADVAGAAGGERVADPQAHGRADRQGGMSPAVNHRASLVSKLRT